MWGASCSKIDQCGAIKTWPIFLQLSTTLNSPPSLLFHVGLTEFSIKTVSDLNFFLDQLCDP